MKPNLLALLLLTLPLEITAQNGQNLLPVKIDYKWGFIDKSGQTISEFAVKAEDLMLLHYEMEYSR